MTKFICISGCTASGKSGLAERIASNLGNSVIINTDALQVYKCWKILTDRPNESSICNYKLYGHVSCKANYNAGNWLNEVKTFKDNFIDKYENFIFVGGTGLYFNLLLNGLNEIPEIEPKIRKESIKHSDSTAFFIDELQKKDPEILKAIDNKNIRRLQRAWEVYAQTGKGLKYWQNKTSYPIFSREKVTKILLDPPKEELINNIEKRVERMIEQGVIDEVETVYKGIWDTRLPFSKAIGAKEVISYLNKECNLDQLKSMISVKTRQFAKRQRTWHRKFMSDWKRLDPTSSKETDMKLITQDLK